jgi:hypothetical protein
MAACVKDLSPAHCAPREYKCEVPCEKKCEPVCEPRGYSVFNWGWCNLLLWFVVIAIIAFIIIWAVKPSWALNKDANGECTEELNGGKVLIAALLIALVIVLIIYFLRCFLC